MDLDEGARDVASALCGDESSADQSALCLSVTITRKQGRYEAWIEPAGGSGWSCGSVGETQAQALMTAGASLARLAQWLPTAEPALRPPDTPLHGLVAPAPLPSLPLARWMQQELAQLGAAQPHRPLDLHTSG